MAHITTTQDQLDRSDFTSGSFQLGIFSPTDLFVHRGRLIAIFLRVNDGLGIAKGWNVGRRA